jgi:hypothetical protein
VINDEIPVYDQAILSKFLELKRLLGDAIAKRIRPIIPPGASLDILITIRDGRIMIRPTPLYVEKDFYAKEARLRSRESA